VTSSSALEERLATLEAERAVLDTLYAYGDALDHGREDEWADCWTADAVLTYDFSVSNARSSTDRDDLRFDGRAAICRFYARHTHAPERYHQHLLVAPRIAVDGERATVRSTFARLDERREGPLLSSFGRYTDVLRREPDGRWRFASRHADVESRAARDAPEAR
jgi:ketosteroid isomerase-like protein